MDEKKSIKVSLGTVICICIIFILIIALMIMWYYYNNQNQVGNTVNSQITTTEGDKEEKLDIIDKEEDININSETVKNLYAKILKAESEYGLKENPPKTYSFYKADKVTVDNLDNDERNFAVINYLFENSYGKKTVVGEIKNSVKNKLSYFTEGLTDDPTGGEAGECIIYNNEEIEYVKNIIFGSSTKIDYNTYTGLARVIEFIDGDYYFYHFPGGGRGPEDRIFTKIEKATKQGDYIYIYDKCLYVDLESYYSDSSNEKLAYYTNTSKTNKIDTQPINDWQAYYNADSSYMDKYISQLDTYKHTFKKDSNGNYCWVSSEPIKQ